MKGTVTQNKNSQTMYAPLNWGWGSDNPVVDEYAYLYKKGLVLPNNKQL